MKRLLGFTLTELIITLVLVAIFITFVLPSYYTMIQNNHIVNIVNNLSAGINLAKMEAIKRGVKVSICPAANVALTTCGSASQWTQGWLVFTDADHNNAVDAVTNLVRINDVLGSGVVVNASSNMISFDGSGFTTTGTFTLSVSATGCTGNNMRTLNLSSSGRLSIVKSRCN